MWLKCFIGMAQLAQIVSIKAKLGQKWGKTFLLGGQSEQKAFMQFYNASIFQ